MKLAFFVLVALLGRRSLATEGEQVIKEVKEDVIVKEENISVVDASAAKQIVNDVTVVNAVRIVDLSKELSNVTTTFELENAHNLVLHAIDAADAQKMAFIYAKVDGKTARVSSVDVDGQSDGVSFYKVELSEAVSASGTVKLVITAVIDDMLQTDSHLAHFTGNAHVLSPYTIKRCKSTVKLSGAKVDSSTKVAPSEHTDARVIYGVYDNVAPMSVAPISIKFSSLAGDKSQMTPDPMDMYKPKKDEKHTFAVPEVRPPPSTSDLFAYLCVAPLLIVLGLWLKIGLNFGAMPATPTTFGFHAGLGGILYLFFTFWLRLNMFTTIKYLTVIGLATFLCGNRMLATMAAQRKGKKGE